ncbi:RsfA family transcriptional regulator [Domibacillus robiginosus]|uniref:RsfA family transcriptional regulator n=1 Tax=Domibacillus robiginosus TaxID=1071054 RepID=UPI00067AE18E|nr:RsfA family transcriptional regulator [Domibacillus robiginosus]
MKTRQDAWSEENDLLLAETVLRHVREGSTQLKAFEEVGDKLNRTGAACGFRWNAVIRQQYEKALSLARKQRKQHYRNQQKQERVSSGLRVVEKKHRSGQKATEDLNSDSLTIKEVIGFLETLNVSGEDYDFLQRELETIKREKAELETKYEQLEKSALTMKNDYEEIVKIMDRARRMVVFNDEEAMLQVENNNLEKIAE